jgi:large subunit ribosomal protein L2
MALQKLKPTSPGQRGTVKMVSNHTAKASNKKLLKPLKGPKGRSKGQVSVRHQSRGAKKHYRVIDFKRDKAGIKGFVIAIEYDPNRNCNIALIHYTDGEKRYILAPSKLKVKDTIISDTKVKPENGNAMQIKNIPLGVPIHNIELNPKKGGVMVRSAGTYAVITAKEGEYANIKMPSGEVRKFLQACYATIGELGNSDFKNKKIGKAGRDSRSKAYKQEKKIYNFYSRKIKCCKKVP